MICLNPQNVEHRVGPELTLCPPTPHTRLLPANSLRPLASLRPAMEEQAGGQEPDPFPEHSESDSCPTFCVYLFLGLPEGSGETLGSI